MEREKHSQLELFYQGQEFNEKKPDSRLSNSFWVYISNYEKIILVVIGFIITGIISFCLGVEKGKTITGPKFNPQFDIVQKQELKSQELKPLSPKKQVMPQPQIQEQESGYTVQVASFRTKTNAEKEMEGLKKKGFSALIVSKGEYMIVCVGSFSDKETAKSLLSQLRQKYRDCYIRRL